jgi:Tol biopolymer transport system component
MRLFRHFLLLLPVAAAAQAPERVAPDVIATDRNETFPAIDPRTGDLWFSRYDRGFDDQVLMVARRTGDTWAAPVQAGFSGTHGDRAPRFSPDGGVLYFTSNRPAPNRVAGDLNIWAADRAGSGWSAPRVVDPLSTSERDMHNAPVAGGAHFVASYRPGGLGRADIWHVAADGTARPVGPPINDAGGQPDLWVSPDGTWMILVITDPAGGLGGDDLLVSEFRDGAWTVPRLLPAPINSDEYEYGPWVAGDWLYFTSHRGGNADIWLVPVSAVR